MVNITDLINDTLQQLLDEHNGTIHIQRNDLALRIGCVPSQINYVITSRYTKAQGYIVESRRGGGGFVKIIKLDLNKAERVINIIKSIGDMVDEATARELIKALFQDNKLSELQANLMLAATTDDNFKGLNDDVKRQIRANILKSMLIRI